MWFFITVLIIIKTILARHVGESWVGSDEFLRSAEGYLVLELGQDPRPSLPEGAELGMFVIYLTI